MVDFIWVPVAFCAGGIVVAGILWWKTAALVDAYINFSGLRAGSLEAVLAIQSMPVKSTPSLGCINPVSCKALRERAALRMRIGRKEDDMKKAELALTLVLRELQNHIDKSMDRRMKIERDRPEDAAAYVMAAAEWTAYDIARMCVTDVAEMMQITLKPQD